MYQALYRKYRPKIFDDVMGQEHITTTLKSEIASGRIAHAYLFTGSRGTGKTSCSRILAKAVNCPNQIDGNPCSVCDICKGIEDGSILDVTEIDAASNSGVDNIRQLREEANFTPAIVKYRVYIIDETHMLSPGAFNALLKIMEEPPAHVIFILATTEAHKIPATILSRCQRFDFKRIKTSVIQDCLLEICKKESVYIDDEAARLIARLSEGGMRDAQSLLDVCISRNLVVHSEESSPEQNAQQITVSMVTQAAGLALQDYLFRVADAVLSQDIPTIITMLDEMHQNSIDFEKICTQLIAHYRGLMMARAVHSPEQFLLCTDEDIARLKEQSAKYTMPHILYCLTVLQDTLSRMNRTAQTRTELEMALVRLGNPELDDSVAALSTRLQKLEEAIRAGIAPKSIPLNKPVSEKLSKQEQQLELHKKPKEKDPIANTGEVKPFLQWSALLEQLKTSNSALHGALVSASAYQSGDFVLIDCEDPFFLQMIRNSEYSKKSIHDALIMVAGRDFRIGPFKKETYKANQPTTQTTNLAYSKDQLDPNDQVEANDPTVSNDQVASKDPIASNDPMESIIATALTQGVDVDVQ